MTVDMCSVATDVADLSVLHIGAGRHHPADRSHATFDIWRSLAAGFRRYTVVNRSTEPTSAILKEGNLTVHLLPSRTSREAEFLVSQFQAFGIADKVRAEVIISQSPALGGWAGVAASRRLGAKHLVELHSDEFFKAATFGSRDWILKKLSGPVLRRAHRIRVLTERMKDCVVSQYGQELVGRTVCLPPRVDTTRFQAKTNWASTGLLKVVMVGSVIERKGQRRLIEVLLRSNAPVEIWIVGDGPELPSCREVAAHLGGEDRVRFFGRVTHAELAKILPKADVFVMYSRHEGTPRAIMEAMAVGLPVVTTNAGFCADIVTHNVEGTVLGPRPDDEVAEALKRLAADAALRTRMGQAGRARAERDYDANKVYARYRQLIAETAQV